MKKFGRDKIALFLACTSVLGGKTQAMNTKGSNPQTVAAVGGAVSRSNKSVKQGLTKNQKLAIAVAASVVGVTAIGLIILGVKKHLDNKNDPNKNKGNKGGNKDNIDEDGSHKNNDDVKNPKSNKKDVNEEGYDYVSEVNNRLKVAGKEKEKDLKSFNEAVDVIKNHKFNENDMEQIGEFLKVVKGEKKIPKEVGGLFNFKSCFILGESNVVGVDLDDGIYMLRFTMKGFEIQKYDKNFDLIYSLKL